MAAGTTKSFGVALGLALLYTASARATVVELPLPALTGTYSCADPTPACARTVPIHQPTNPSVIRSVSLRFHGTTSFATFTCDFGSPYLQHTQFEAQIYEPGQQSATTWGASHENQVEGEVAATEPFARGPFTHGTLDFLLDGTAALNFYVAGYSPILECFLTGPSDSTTLDEVTLLVEGDFPTPVRGPSWGRLKLLYR